MLRKSLLSLPLVCVGPSLSTDVDQIRQVLCRAACARTSRLAKGCVTGRREGMSLSCAEQLLWEHQESTQSVCETV